MEAEILAHIDLYGVTTQAIAARFCHDEKQAASCLKNLVAKRKLKEYRFGFDRNTPLFFVRRERLLLEKEEKRRLRDDWAILRFCLNEGVERFSQAAFFELLGSFIERVGGKVKYAPAYTYGEKLSLIRVHHPPRKGTPQQARADLETFVNLPQFSLWWMLTRGDMFALTYLVPVGWADELRRWLEREPLVSGVGGEDIHIPVRIEETENILPRQDKTQKAWVLSSTMQSKVGLPVKKSPAGADGAAIV